MSELRMEYGTVRFEHTNTVGDAKIYRCYYDGRRVGNIALRSNGLWDVNLSLLTAEQRDEAVDAWHLFMESLSQHKES